MKRNSIVTFLIGLAIFCFHFQNNTFDLIETADASGGFSIKYSSYPSYIIEGKIPESRIMFGDDLQKRHPMTVILGDTQLICPPVYQDIIYVTDSGANAPVIGYKGVPLLVRVLEVEKKLKLRAETIILIKEIKDGILFPDESTPHPFVLVGGDLISITELVPINLVLEFSQPGMSFTAIDNKTLKKYTSKKSGSKIRFTEKDLVYEDIEIKEEKEESKTDKTEKSSVKN